MARALHSCHWGQGHGGGSRSDDGEDIIVIKAIREDHSMRVWDACQWDAGCGMCGMQDAGCMGCGMWDARDAGCVGCGDAPRSSMKMKANTQLDKN